MLLRKDQTVVETVVFLHGFLGSSKDFAPYVSLLEKEYEILTPNLPGHGGAPNYPIDALLDTIPPHSHLVGYSMGARIALYFLEKRPDLFLSAFLISVNPGLESTSARELRKEKDLAWITLLEEKGLHAFIDAWYKQLLFPETKVVPERYIQNEVNLISAMRTFSPSVWPSFWHLLENPPCPITLLFGENDILYTPIYERIRDNTRLSTFLIPRAAHAIFLDEEALCMEKITDHLEALCKH